LLKNATEKKGAVAAAQMQTQLQAYLRRRRLQPKINSGTNLDLKSMDKLVKLKRREEIRSNPCKFATPGHLESSAPKNGGGEMNLIEGWGKVKYAVHKIQI